MSGCVDCAECPVGEYWTALLVGSVQPAISERPAQLSLRAAAHLGHWASACGIPNGQLDEQLDAFTRHLPSCTCMHGFRGRDHYHATGARRFVEYLQTMGSAQGLRRAGSGAPRWSRISPTGCATTVASLRVRWPTTYPWWWTLSPHWAKTPQTRRQLGPSLHLCPGKSAWLRWRQIHRDAVRCLSGSLLLMATAQPSSLRLFRA